MEKSHFLRCTPCTHTLVRLLYNKDMKSTNCCCFHPTHPALVNLFYKHNSRVFINQETDANFLFALPSPDRNVLLWLNTDLVYENVSAWCSFECNCRIFNEFQRIEKKLAPSGIFVLWRMTVQRKRLVCFFQWLT